nr:hypothetical protein [Oceanospirillaceae bacterium]
ALQGIASWYVFMCQVQAQIIQFDYIEPNWTLLEPLLDGQNATNFIECEDLWGQLPVQFPLFKQQLTQAITLMLARFPVA